MTRVSAIWRLPEELPYPAQSESPISEMRLRDPTAPITVKLRRVDGKGGRT